MITEQTGATQAPETTQETAEQKQAREATEAQARIENKLARFMKKGLETTPVEMAGEMQAEVAEKTAEVVGESENLASEAREVGADEIAQKSEGLGNEASAARDGLDLELGKAGTEQRTEKVTQTEEAIPTIETLRTLMQESNTALNVVTDLDANMSDLRKWILKKEDQLADSSDEDREELQKRLAKNKEELVYLISQSEEANKKYLDLSAKSQDYGKNLETYKKTGERAQEAQPAKTIQEQWQDAVAEHSAQEEKRISEQADLPPEQQVEIISKENPGNFTNEQKQYWTEIFTNQQELDKGEHAMVNPMDLKVGDIIVTTGGKIGDYPIKSYLRIESINLDPDGFNSEKMFVRTSNADGQTWVRQTGMDLKKNGKPIEVIKPVQESQPTPSETEARLSPEKIKEWESNLQEVKKFEKAYDMQLRRQNLDSALMNPASFEFDNTDSTNPDSLFNLSKALDQVVFNIRFNRENNLPISEEQEKNYKELNTKVMRLQAGNKLEKQAIENSNEMAPWKEHFTDMPDSDNSDPNNPTWKHWANPLGMYFYQSVDKFSREKLGVSSYGYNKEFFEKTTRELEEKLKQAQEKLDNLSQ